MSEAYPLQSSYADELTVMFNKEYQNVIQSRNGRETAPRYVASGG